MAAKFCEVTIDDWKSLPPVFRRFVFGKEIALSIPVHSEPQFLIEIVILTSIINGESSCRDVGQDAIRVLLIYTDADGNGKEIVLDKKNIHRAVGKNGSAKDIVNRALSAARELWKTVRVFKRCNLCGRPMVIKKGKIGPFYGCLGFTIVRCKGTASLKIALEGNK